MKNTNTGTPSAETLKAWKEKYGENIYVFEAIHPKEKTKHYLYLKSPSLVDSQRAISSENAKAGTYPESLFNNCKIQCDPEIENNEAMLRGIYNQISKAIEVADVTVKKL